MSPLRTLKALRNGCWSFLTFSLPFSLRAPCVKSRRPTATLPPQKPETAPQLHPGVTDGDRFSAL